MFLRLFIKIFLFAINISPFFFLYPPGRSIDLAQREWAADLMPPYIGVHFRAAAIVVLLLPHTHTTHTVSQWDAVKWRDQRGGPPHSPMMSHLWRNPHLSLSLPLFHPLHRERRRSPVAKTHTAPGGGSALSLHRVYDMN